MFWFTSDEHFGHRNIIKYSNRPFSSIEEMNATLIANHNEVVKAGDTTIHCGDFTLNPAPRFAQDIIAQLSGQHVFLRGSHDKWLTPTAHEIWEKKIEDQWVVCCHYAMRTWARSHYGSWQCYGHSHGHLPPIGLQWDVGVDNNGFYPVSFDQLKAIMMQQKDIPNLSKSEILV